MGHLDAVSMTRNLIKKLDEEIGRVMGIPILWRTTKERYSLQGEVCPECERLVFPPRRLCPYCGRKAEALHTEMARQEYSFVLSQIFNNQPVGLSAAGDD
jgi:uncharacterized OB-fold protein